MTVLYTDPVASAPVSQLQSLRELVDDINGGAVDALLVLGGNPAYDAPVDLRFGDALKKVAFTARLGLYEDETSALCQWHIPEAHSLEAWSDARAWDGTATIMQPLIAPLYGGKSAHDMLIGLSQTPGRAAYDVVRETWRLAAAGAGALDADLFWRKAVHDGVVAGTAFPPRTVTAGDVFAGHRPAGARRHGPRTRAARRPHGPRRALREPGLAPGAAEAVHEAHLGQHRAAQPGHGLPPRHPQRGRRRGRRRRPDGEGAGVDRAGPGRRHRRGAPGLRPHARRARRERRGLRRLRPAHLRRPVGGAGRRPSRRRAAGRGWRARSSTTTWTAARSSARARSSSTARTRTSCTRWSTSRRRRSRCIPSTSTRATRGAWPST